ncbi:MAG: type III pantothenate kinase [Clostridia bacterium]|nr:type III pantothenate kinase [Clostridia bacterium]
MILAVLIRNREITLGCMDGTAVVAEASVVTAERSADEYALLFRDVLALRNVCFTNFDGVILASVVPTLTDTVIAALGRLTDARVRVVGCGTKTGLHIRIEDPAQLGTDLVCSAVAAAADYPTPLLLIDAGTATAFSVLGGDGAYLGCAIAPGIALSSAALSAAASLLPSVATGAPAKCIGTTTAESMKSGSLYGTAAMLDGMIARMERELGVPFATVLATGDVIRDVLPACDTAIGYDETLALRGLALIHERSTKKK